MRTVSTLNILFTLRQKCANCKLLSLIGVETFTSCTTSARSSYASPSFAIVGRHKEELQLLVGSLKFKYCHLFELYLTCKLIKRIGRFLIKLLYS